LLKHFKAQIGSFKNVRRTLKTFRKFSPRKLSLTLYPFREASTGSENFGFLDALLTSSEASNFKSGLKSLLEDPHEVADQLN
jgi:hypothetical protein